MGGEDVLLSTASSMANTLKGVADVVSACKKKDIRLKVVNRGRWSVGLRVMRWLRKVSV